MIFHVFHAAFWGVAVAALLASAWTDVKDRIIPNELTALVAVSGLCLSLIVRPGEIWISLLAGTLALIALGFIAHFGMIGGGDVKLISATTLLVPPGHIGQLLLSIAIAGGVLSCAYLIAHYALRSRVINEPLPTAEVAGKQDQNAAGWFSNECARIAAGGPMPYALAILGGVTITIAGELPKCLFAMFCSL